jgi:predicted transcriptional regulator
MPDSDTELTIPPALAAEIKAAAEDEHRPAADVVREALVGYLENRRWQQHAEQELSRARELGLPDDDVPLTSEYRPTIREKIAQGLESARQGRLVDGEAVFARIDAELDELERQGRR